MGQREVGTMMGQEISTLAWETGPQWINIPNFASRQKAIAFCQASVRSGVISFTAVQQRVSSAVGGSPLAPRAPGENAGVRSAAVPAPMIRNRSRRFGWFEECLPMMAHLPYRSGQ